MIYYNSQSTFCLRSNHLSSAVVGLFSVLKAVQSCVCLVEIGVRNLKWFALGLYITFDICVHIYTTFTDKGETGPVVMLSIDVDRQIGSNYYPLQYLLMDQTDKLYFDRPHSTLCNNDLCTTSAFGVHEL